MNADYARIATAIRFIVQNLENQPTLEQIAGELGLSPCHFQRLFRRWAGVSPKRFLQFLTVEHAKQRLACSQSVLDTSYELGLSSPARLYDHFVALEAVTPGEYKNRGVGLTLYYGVHPSPFGPIFLAVTDRGVCALTFLAGQSLEAELAALQRFWSGARLAADKAITGAIAERIFSRVPGDEPLILLVKGTNFQISVWKALLKIPPGLLCSYAQIARAIGRPSAARAVAQAVATNPVGYLIPCHRVIRSVGLLGGYRWGETRKRALIAWEAAHCISPSP